MTADLSEHEQMRALQLEIVRARYTWEMVCSAYEQALLEVM